jgi:hypothetical protein
MRANQVEVGKTYRCKVGRNTVEVRIKCTSPKGGWDATLVSTGKAMAIRDAKRLLGPATVEQAQEKKGAEKKPREKRGMSCLDAAAKVLEEAGAAMNCRDMISTMTEKGYWTTPGGKTPAATLYSAILREIGRKGKDARFKKVERGKFALNT